MKMLLIKYPHSSNPSYLMIPKKMTWDDVEAAYETWGKINEERREQTFVYWLIEHREARFPHDDELMQWVEC